MKEPSYAIFGMNRLGRKLTTMLTATGAQILIADPDENVINRYAEYATYAVSLDLTNPSALEEIGLEHIDIAVVDLRFDLESAIMTITMARELGVKKIIATARTERMADIFKRVGADEIIIPEDESAVRMARRLISEDFLEYYDLGGSLCIIKIHPKKEWIGKTIKRLHLPEKEDVKIVAIENNGEMLINFTPDTIIKEDSAIVLSLRKDAIYHFV